MPRICNPEVLRSNPPSLPLDDGFVFGFVVNSICMAVNTYRVSNAFVNLNQSSNDYCYDIEIKLHRFDCKEEYCVNQGKMKLILLIDLTEYEYNDF